MIEYKMKNNKAILLGEIRKLLNAGFPVCEISKFLDLDEAEVKKYKKVIDRYQNQE